jgi:hypothetical protein
MKSQWFKTGALSFAEINPKKAHSSKTARLLCNVSSVVSRLKMQVVVA